MTTAWSIVEYPGRDGLMRLEPDWTRLVSAMPDAGFQHLHESHVSYLDKLPSEFGAFNCLALSDGSRIRAICPVEPQRLDVFRAFKSPAWGLPLGLGDMPRDVICPADADAEAALLPCVAAHLRKTRPRYNWFVLGRVLEGSVAWRCLRAIDAGRYYADRDDAAHMIDCDQPFAGITSRLSRKFRANMRSAHNRLAKLPDVHFERTVDAACMDAAFDRFLKVEASGWKGEAGDRTAIAVKPKQLAFYRSWVAGLTASGCCEFNELRSGDTCVASTFCVHVDEECAVVKIGYDERFAQVAPGHLVLERIFQQYCDDPSAKRISLVSAFAWNARWEPEVVGSYNVYLGIGGWMARARVGLLRMSFRYWPLIKRWLQRSGAGGRIARRFARG
ncbi:MAG: GNAT family N-acetyltransferase [Gemmatimonadaceae bacterium]